MPQYPPPAVASSSSTLLLHPLLLLLLLVPHLGLSHTVRGVESACVCVCVRVSSSEGSGEEGVSGCLSSPRVCVGGRARGQGSAIHFTFCYSRARWRRSAMCSRSRRSRRRGRVRCVTRRWSRWAPAAEFANTWCTRPANPRTTMKP